MTCIICTHPLVKEIENITNTISLREACRQYKVSGASVSRHMRHLRASGDMTVVPVNAAPDIHNGLTKQQKKFLEAYVEHGTIHYAAQAVGLTRSMHNYWISKSPVYEKAFEDIRDAYNDRIRNKFAEILELPASEHIKHPVALIALARSRMPEFASPEQNVINVNIANLPNATDTQVKSFLAGRKKEDIIEGELAE